MNQLSHYRTTLNKWGEQINVPVIDVRDGISHRIMAIQMVKSSPNHRSKWIPYNQLYQTSSKKTKII